MIVIDNFGYTVICNIYPFALLGCIWSSITIVHIITIMYPITYCDLQVQNENLFFPIFATLGRDTKICGGKIYFLSIILSTKCFIRKPKKHLMNYGKVIDHVTNT